MRKLGFGFLGLILVGVIYYFTLGKTQLITEVKQQVDTELTLLQKEGFKVENRKVKKASDYFELSLSDKQKALAFFKSHGVAVEATDLASLEGMKLGIGLQYLPDSYTSVALDMIPLTLPTQLSKEANPSQQKALHTLQKLLDKKAIAIHIAVNKVGNGFKGYVKDIDEVLEGEKKTHLQVKGLTFHGELEKQKLHTFSQNLKTMSINVPQEFNTTLSNLDNHYENHAKGYKNLYTFDTLLLNTAEASMEVNHVSIDSLSTIVNKVATIEVHNQSKEIKVVHKNEQFVLEDVNLTSIAKNLDISAFEKLQSIDAENKEEVQKLLSQLLSKGVVFSIPSLSVGYITLQNQKIEGFDVNAHVSIDKNIPVATLSTNPMKTLPYIDANLKVALSPALLAYIAKRPKAMLAMMMFQPQDKEGKKVYQIELKKGKALLNGKSIF